MGGSSLGQGGTTATGSTSVTGGFFGIGGTLATGGVATTGAIIGMAAAGASGREVATVGEGRTGSGLVPGCIAPDTAGLRNEAVSTATQAIKLMACTTST